MMGNSVEEWRMLSRLLLSQQSLEEVLSQAERDRRIRESQESRDREPRQTPEQAVAQLHKDLHGHQMTCANVAGALMFIAAGLNIISTEFANAALALMMVSMCSFLFLGLIDMWIYVFDMF